MRDRAQQHQHPLPRPRADDVIRERAHAGERVLVPLRDARSSSAPNLVEIRLRLIERDARLEPRDRRQIDAHVVRVADAFVGRNDVRHPEFGRPGGADRILKSGAMTPTTS